MSKPTLYVTCKHTAQERFPFDASASINGTACSLFVFLCDACESIAKPATKRAPKQEQAPAPQAPRGFVARYNGKCVHCTKPIVPGQRISWRRGGRGAWHIECAPKVKITPNV